MQVRRISTDGQQRKSKMDVSREGKKVSYRDGTHLKRGMGCGVMKTQSYFICFAPVSLLHDGNSTL